MIVSHTRIFLSDRSSGILIFSPARFVIGSQLQRAEGENASPLKSATRLVRADCGTFANKRLSVRVINRDDDDLIDFPHHIMSLRRLDDWRDRDYYLVGFLAGAPKSFSDFNTDRPYSENFCISRLLNQQSCFFCSDAALSVFDLIAHVLAVFYAFQLSLSRASALPPRAKRLSLYNRSRNVIHGY